MCVCMCVCVCVFIFEYQELGDKWILKKKKEHPCEKLDFEKFPLRHECSESYHFFLYVLNGSLVRNQQLICILSTLFPFGFI